MLGNVELLEKRVVKGRDGGKRLISRNGIFYIYVHIKGNARSEC